MTDHQYSRLNGPSHSHVRCTIFPYVSDEKILPRARGYLVYQKIRTGESAEIRATLLEMPYERQICTEQKIPFEASRIRPDLLFVYIRSFLLGDI